MKTKIILSCLLLLMTGLIVMSFNFKEKSTEAFKKDINCEEKCDSKKNLDMIKCNGDIYNVYPILDSIKNKEFAKIIKSLPKLDVNKDFLWGANNALSKNLADYIFSKFKKYLYNGDNIFIDYKTRIDSARIEWDPVYQLPTNGKFIMLVMDYSDVDFDARSSGYFLCTFKLNGEMLSMIYAYGQEELDRRGLNKELLNLIWGRAYCLNTNKPIIRKATNWDFYIDRNGYYGTTLEVKELKYSIDEQGYIKLDKENAIFSKKHVQWKERSGISFYESSDTIRKMLGKIE